MKELTLYYKLQFEEKILVFFLCEHTNPYPRLILNFIDIYILLLTRKKDRWDQIFVKLSNQMPILVGSQSVLQLNNSILYFHSAPISIRCRWHWLSITNSRHWTSRAEVTSYKENESLYHNIISFPQSSQEANGERNIIYFIITSFRLAWRSSQSRTPSEDGSNLWRSILLLNKTTAGAGRFPW